MDSIRNLQRRPNGAPRFVDRCQASRENCTARPGLLSFRIRKHNQGGTTVSIADLAAFIANVAVWAHVFSLFH